MAECLYEVKCRSAGARGGSIEIEGRRGTRLGFVQAPEMYRGRQRLLVRALQVANQALEAFGIVRLDSTCAGRRVAGLPYELARRSLFFKPARQGLSDALLVGEYQPRAAYRRRWTHFLATARRRGACKQDRQRQHFACAVR